MDLPSADDFFHFLYLLVVLYFVLIVSLLLLTAVQVQIEHLCQLHLLGRDPVWLQVDRILVLNETSSAYEIPDLFAQLRALRVVLPSGVIWTLASILPHSIFQFGPGSQRSLL